MREIQFKITAENDGAEIRHFLRAFGVSAALLRQLKQTENGITKNGVFARAIETVSAGDTLCIRIENKGHMPQPQTMDIEICYEDEDILVCNKPPQLPVHESRHHIGDTLSNFVACHLQEDTAFRAVYRLDKDTSGLVVIAKHGLAAAKLAGSIQKEYMAVCAGILEGAGVVDAPIARCDDSLMQRQVCADGQRAVTHYEALSHVHGNTLLRLQLETGRTHQIRVHLAHIGHPLLGDTLYGGDTGMIQRQALHCGSLVFTHPVTEKSMSVSCALPADMQVLL